MDLSSLFLFSIEAMKRNSIIVLPSKERLHKLRFLQKLGCQKPCWDQASLVNKQIVSVVDLASGGSANKGSTLSSPNISKKSTVKYFGSSLKLFQVSWQGSGFPPAAPAVQPAPSAQSNATATPRLPDPFRSGKILRTNGASKTLGFSFLLDPMLNDIYHNENNGDETLNNNFFEGFQVMSGSIIENVYSSQGSIFHFY